MPLPCAGFSGEVTAGSNTGTGGRQVGTNGTGSGTGGTPRWAVLVVCALLVAKALVDAQSIADRTPAMPAWQPYALELTSAAFFAAILWPLWQATRLLRPPRLAWPAALTAHLALSLPLVLAHAVWLAASRALVFALAGSQYQFGWSLVGLFFEWRKDVVTLLALVGVGYLLDQMFAAPAAPSGADSPPYRLTVRDGTRTLLLAPGEIERATSAGNYVELFTVHGPVLHRVTLTALARELQPHGFARIHRAHLVRADAVVAVASEGSGDFAVTLISGAVLPGSRRWRDALQQFGPVLRR